MKLEYVITGLAVGGAEVMLCELALGMKGRGHDVGVVSLLQPSAYVERLTSAGIRVLSLDLGRDQKNPLSVARIASRFRRHIRAVSPDIVHSHMVHANLFARLTLAFTGQRLICTMHNIYEGGRIRDAGYRLTNWASTLNTTISTSATRRAVAGRVLPASTITIYNGIDTVRFSPSADHGPARKPFRWLAVGRLERQKDYPTLLRAMRQCAGARLSIAGEGSQREELERLADDLGVAGRVKFLGVRRDIPELMREHDGFVLSSAWEGFGIVVAEAMASGLPVVATDSGGPAEIVGRDGSCGLIVPPEDADSLAAAMSRIALLSASERARMCAATRRRAMALFDLQSILDQWARVYAAVHDGKQPGSLM